MASNPKTKSDILLEVFGGRFVGGTLSQLANYSELFLRMKEAVFLLDKHSFRVLECNPSALKLFKRAEDQVLGEVFTAFFPDGVIDLPHGLAQGIALPVQFKGKTGDQIYFEVTATPLQILDYIEVVQVVVNDVTDVKRAQNELHEANAVLKKLSTTDEMTGLWNFRYFKEALESVHHHAATTQSSYGVIFIDVDHFKKFNDRNGHPAGDQVLKKVASILSETVASYQFAARYGGEEFVVLSRNSSLAETRATAEKICAAIYATDFEHGEHQPLGRVSVSIGVAAFPAHGVIASEVLHHADLALYQSKENGRNQVTDYSEVKGGAKKSPKKRSA